MDLEQVDQSRLKLMPFNNVAVAASIALASCVFRLTVAAGEPVYLPAVGPPPLRFALPPPTPQVVVSLPPLVVPGSESVAPTADAAQVVPGPAAGPTNSADVHVAGPAQPAPAAPGLEPTKPEEGSISSFFFPVPIDPQLPSAPLWQNDPAASGLTPDLRMLMRFFVSHPTNNAPAVSVFGPVPFIPPAPRPPTSSAAFETTPAGKP